MPMKLLVGNTLMMLLLVPGDSISAENWICESVAVVLYDIFALTYLAYTDETQPAEDSRNYIKLEICLYFCTPH